MTRLSLPARRLLAYLAIRGAPVARERAAAEIWPDHPEEVGRTNLRRALWHLPGGWVTALGDELLLDAVCDLADARRVAGRAIKGEALGFDEIDLLANDLLPGWQEEWTVPAQDAFRLLRVQALEAACRTLAAHGDPALAVQAGAAALAAEPLRESAAEALIDAHLAQNNRFAAMQCFRALAARLDEELGVAPGVALGARLDSIAAPRRAAAHR